MPNESGEAWQEYCNSLLSVRHGEAYQRVPDTVRGDWGIEGFTRSGILYQCFAPEEPITAEIRRERIRDKITADMTKLRKNLSNVTVLVTPITMWVLLTPRVDDKSLLTHGAAKAMEINADLLPGVDPSFCVRLHTAEDFPAERMTLGQQMSLDLAVQNADAYAIAGFRPSPPLSLQNLETKLGRVASDHRELQRARDEYVGLYLDAQSLEVQLHDRYPALYQEWRTARAQVSRMLTISRLGLTSQRGSVESILNRLNSAAAESIPHLEMVYIDILANGAIAEWLLECPLDLQPSGASQP